jgi:hypothetical protein
MGSFVDPRWLNLELCDSTGAPLSGRPYALTLANGTRRTGALDHAGCLCEAIPPGCERVVLFVAQREFELELGGIPACDSLLGAQERLNHLNYFIGTPDGELGPRTDAALRRFQRDHGLAPTGRLDPATIERLLAEHGS